VGELNAFDEVLSRAFFLRRSILSDLPDHWADAAAHLAIKGMLSSESMQKIDESLNDLKGEMRYFIESLVLPSYDTRSRRHRFRRTRAPYTMSLEPPKHLKDFSRYLEAMADAVVDFELTRRRLNQSSGHESQPTLEDLSVLAHKYLKRTTAVLAHMTDVNVSSIRRKQQADSTTLGTLSTLATFFSASEPPSSA
jgi:hypothetical protein